MNAEADPDPKGVPGSAAPSILTSGNPAGLSKAEYRVCSLLVRGFGAKAISGSLGVSESTVRSHLRSIYSKTNTHGQRELMFRLLGANKQAELFDPVAPPVRLARVSEHYRSLFGQRSGA